MKNQFISHKKKQTRSWEIPNWNGLFCANAGAPVLLYLFYSELRVMPDSDTPQVMTGNQLEASHTYAYIIHNTQYDICYMQFMYTYHKLELTASPN